MNAIKKSITLPLPLDRYVSKRARRLSKARGEVAPNYSAAIADLIIEARAADTKKEAA